MSVTIASGQVVGNRGGDIGPFQDSNDNLYCILNTGVGTLRVFKSSNDGANWTGTSTGSEPAFGTAWSAFQEGTNIHLAVQGTSGAVTYSRFATSDAPSGADTWTEIDTAVITPSNYPGNTRPVGIVVRSDGERVLMYSGAERVHGTDYYRASCVRYISSWGSEISIGDTGSPNDSYCLSIALGEANKVHFLVYQGAGNDADHTSLATGTSTPSALELAEANVGLGYYGVRGTYVDESGVESIKFAEIRSTTSEFLEYEIRDDASPETPVTITSSEAPNDGSSLLYASGHPEGARLIFIYSDSATDDIWFRQDTGSGWGSAVEIQDGVTAGAGGSMVCAHVYSNSSNEYVIGYIWFNGTNTVFDEYLLVAGGTLFTQSVAGSITPSGVIIKRTNLSPDGSLTLSGSIVRDTFISVSGALTPVGALIKQTLLSLSGNLTPSGVLDAVRIIVKAVGGSLTPSGSLFKQTGKPLAGSINPTGAFVKRTNKVVAGSVTPTGNATKQTNKPVVGSVTPTGTLIKRTNKPVSGSITPTGSLVRDIAIAVAGSIDPSGALTKEVQKILAGSITPSGVLDAIRTIVKAVGGSLTPSGNLSKSTSKSISGSVTPTGTPVKRTNKLTAGSVTPSGVTTKRTNKPVSGSVTPTGTATKRTNKPVGGSVSPVGSLVRSTLKVVAGALTAVGTLVADFIAGGATFFQSAGGSITPSGSLTKQTQKSLLGNLLLSGNIVKNIRKTLAGILAPVGALIRQIAGVPVPESRIYAIAGEDRTYAIPSEDRTFIVSSEDRTYAISG